jgi:tocopherol O-methyltransferase
MGSAYMDRVARFYNVVQVGYDYAVSGDYLRYGLWDESTRTAAESLVNTDRFVAELLQLGADDIVLDAGCGVGGSAIFFAKTFGARVVGVNISAGQLKRARRKADRAGLSDRVEFQEKDFCATDLPAGGFTKLYAIESIYHAEDIGRFIAEAARLLAPGGRIAVVDRFLAREPANADEARQYDRFRVGQVVSGLPTLADFRRRLEAAGFADVEFFDRLQSIQRSVAQTHRMCALSYPVSLVLSKLRLLPRELHSQTAGLMAIRRLFLSGMVTYGGFAARKL